MASSFEQYQKRRLLTSYFSVVLSIFLVLFLLGILGLFVVNSKKISNDFKEEIAMSVYFKDEANDTILKAFDAELKASKYVKTYKFVSKDQAAKEHTDIIGEDFLTFLGTNPLQNSFDIYMKADFVDAANIKVFERQIKQNNMVSDIIYDKQLVDLVNENIKKVSTWILIASGILLVIAILLINSSLRLSIYSHRFTIKTMQMVGATKSFIRKPFIWTSVKLGVLGATLAVIGIVAVLFYIDGIYPKLGILTHHLLIFGIVFGILALGVLIPLVSTFFATQKFLNLRTDDLY